MGSWALAFAATQLIEAPIYTAAYRAQGLGRALLIALGASAWTHPLVWSFCLLAPPDERLPLVVLAELFAWLGEGAYLRALGLAAPWRWALVANATSFGVGCLLSALFACW